MKQRIGPLRIASTLCLGLMMVGAAVFVSGGAVAQSQDDTKVSVTIQGPDTVEANTSTKLDVRIESSTPVYAAEFTLSHPNDGVQFTDASQGNFLSNNSTTLVVTNDVTATSVEYGETRLGSDTGVTGTGTISTVTVRISDSVKTSNLNITFDEMIVSDSNATELAATTSNYSATIQGGATTDSDTNTESDSDPDDDSTQESQDSSDTDSGSGVSREFADWQSKVDPRVSSQAQANVSVPVIVQVSADTNLTKVAQRMSEIGLENTTVNTAAGVVTGQVTSSTLSSVASVETVQRVRYNSAVSFERSTPTATQTQTKTKSTQQDGSSGSLTTTETQATTPTLTATHTASGSIVSVTGSGFGLSASVIAAIVLIGILRTHILKN